MAGLKRKEAPKSGAVKASLPQKKQKTAPVKAAAPKSKSKSIPVGEDLPESDTTEDDEFDDLSSEDRAAAQGDDSMSDVDSAPETSKASKTNGSADVNGTEPEKKMKTGTTSAEAHAAQRAIAKERKANKPNADSIQRSKKIWERLRRKSHVPLEERKTLVAELFEIITGRVHDFVFKHDSVRVIQCALKYANKEQKRNIVRELQTDLRPLAESKYGKFLVGKMVVEGDQEIKDMIIPEFYGHVRRLINHPEAAWIVDDIYRQIASPAQKALMLREWYGAEFAVFGKTKASKVAPTSEEATADLATILAQSPEKKKPIMNYLHQLINQLVQKKMTGFTMLHDAMLQYFLNTTPGSEEAGEFLELLKSDLDEEGGGDLLKNLAFTKSGSRVVCLALAYGAAKDRKVILRVYKDTIEMMALDAHAYMVLLTGMDVTDDTKMSSKSIFPELLGEGIKDETEREERLVGLTTHLTARLPILYPLAGKTKWLLTDQQKSILDEVHTIRETKSKKDPEVRRQELLQSISPSLLSLVEHRAQDLATTSFGSQFVTEVLLECVSSDKTAACTAIADLAADDPTSSEHISRNPAAGKMLRTLVQGGKFDTASKSVHVVDPPLGFANILYAVIKPHVLDWACGPSSFVIVALLESDEFGNKEEVMAVLKKGVKKLEKAGLAEKTKDVEGAKKMSEKKRAIEAKGNPGARILAGKVK